MNKHLKKIGLITYGIWGILGAYRGKKEYDNKIIKSQELYFKNPNIYKKSPYYYTSCLGHTIVYIFYYTFPPFLPLCVVVELYNIEKFLRDIEDE